MAHVQPDGHPAQQPPQGAGDHVVPGVLLHVVEPAGPVDLPAHRNAHSQRRVGHVPYVAVLPHQHIQHMNAVQRARVVGLPAGGGIEGAAVQAQAIAPIAGFAFDHLRVEFGQVSVVIV